ncbi:hypothetical protein QE152_g28382 [Popillia japonica]|uniref:Uncharacterized protein n=1 Tax=Popillia japonica TaxID=7064 RepID=A0AAW1JJ74_POPJA
MGSITDYTRRCFCVECSYIRNNKKMFSQSLVFRNKQEITDVDISPPEDWALLTTTHPINVSFQDFVEVDSNVLVCSEPLQTEPLENDSPQLNSQTISSDESDEEITKPSRAEVNSALSTLHTATSDVSQKFDSCLEFISTECLLLVIQVCFGWSVKTDAYFILRLYFLFYFRCSRYRIVSVATSLSWVHEADFG